MRTNGYGMTRARRNPINSNQESYMVITECAVPLMTRSWMARPLMMRTWRFRPLMARSRAVPLPGMWTRGVPLSSFAGHSFRGMTTGSTNKRLAGVISRVEEASNHLQHTKLGIRQLEERQKQLEDELAQLAKEKKEIEALGGGAGGFWPLTDSYR